MAMATILNFSTPQKLPHTTMDIPTKWIIIWLPHHGYQFPTSKSTWKPFAQIGGFLYFGGHFGFKMAAIANQWWISIRKHHNLLGSQISPKSEDFCIWCPFCTLVTMATAAILNFFNPLKLPHTTVDIPTKIHEVWWKESKFFLNPPFFVSMATVAKFVQPIPIFLAYLVPLDVDVVPIKFHQFLFGE